MPGTVQEAYHEDHEYFVEVVDSTGENFSSEQAFREAFKALTAEKLSGAESVTISRARNALVKDTSVPTIVVEGETEGDESADESDDTTSETSSESESEEDEFCFSFTLRENAQGKQEVWVAYAKQPVNTNAGLPGRNAFQGENGEVLAFKNPGNYEVVVRKLTDTELEDFPNPEALIKGLKKVVIWDLDWTITKVHLFKLLVNLRCQLRQQSIPPEQYGDFIRANIRFRDPLVSVMKALHEQGCLQAMATMNNLTDWIMEIGRALLGEQFYVEFGKSDDFPQIFFNIQASNTSNEKETDRRGKRTHWNYIARGAQSLAKWCPEMGVFDIVAMAMVDDKTEVLAEAVTCGLNAVRVTSQDNLHLLILDKLFDLGLDLPHRRLDETHDAELKQMVEELAGVSLPEKLFKVGGDIPDNPKRARRKPSIAIAAGSAQAIPILTLTRPPREQRTPSPKSTRTNYTKPPHPDLLSPRYTPQRSPR